jgi:hypothetical protein
VFEGDPSGYGRLRGEFWIDFGGDRLGVWTPLDPRRVLDSLIERRVNEGLDELREMIRHEKRILFLRIKNGEERSGKDGKSRGT